MSTSSQTTAEVSLLQLPTLQEQFQGNHLADFYWFSNTDRSSVEMLFISERIRPTVLF